MLKLKMMLCVMMLPLVVVSFAHQSSLSVSVREATTASGVDNTASPDWQISPLNGIISPSERG